MGKDKNYVPVWIWVAALLIMWVPFINVLVAFVGAFLGDNDSRKNFFRAQLLLILAGMLLVLLGFVFGIAPDLLREFREWIERI